MEFHETTPMPKRGKNAKTPMKWILAGIIVLVLLILCTMYPPYTTIPAGHTGVVTTFGRVEDFTLNEGFHIKNPIQKVILMDNRAQKESLSMQAFSSDIQQVDVNCSVIYSIDRDTAQTLYQTVGIFYYETVMRPRILENVKAVFTRYSAEKIMEVRNTLSSQVLELLAPEMKAYGIKINSVAIEDVDFTDAFTDAVEEKQVAEQTKLKVETQQAQQVSITTSEAERRIIAAEADAKERTILAEADAAVARVEADAEAYAVRVQAEAQAEANKLVAASVTDKLIEYRKADQWDGKLPTVYGGDAPLPVLDLTDTLKE